MWCFSQCDPNLPFQPQFPVAHVIPYVPGTCPQHHSSVPLYLTFCPCTSTFSFWHTCHHSFCVAGTVLGIGNSRKNRAIPAFKELLVLRGVVDSVEWGTQHHLYTTPHFSPTYQWLEMLIIIAGKGPWHPHASMPQLDTYWRLLGKSVCSR